MNEVLATNMNYACQQKMGEAQEVPAEVENLKETRQNSYSRYNSPDR